MNDTPSKGSSLLLVEDNRSIRETTAELLRFSGATVYTENSGHEAGRFLESHDVDLVLTDLAMPNGDGDWLINWIRNSPRHKHLKVAIMSAHAQPERIQAGIQGGAVDYIVKPFSPEYLLDWVEKALKSN